MPRLLSGHRVSSAHGGPAVVADDPSGVTMFEWMGSSTTTPDANALTYNGEVITYDGAPVTYTEA